MNVCEPWHFSFLIYVFSERRSFQIRYVMFLKHCTDYSTVKCLGWPCPATLFFAFREIRDINHDTLLALLCLSPCALKHMICHAYFRAQVIFLKVYGT